MLGIALLRDSSWTGGRDAEVYNITLWVSKGFIDEYENLGIATYPLAFL